MAVHKYCYIFFHGTVFSIKINKSKMFIFRVARWGYFLNISLDWFWIWIFIFRFQEYKTQIEKHKLKGRKTNVPQLNQHKMKFIIETTKIAGTKNNKNWTTETELKKNNTRHSQVWIVYVSYKCIIKVFYISYKCSACYQAVIRADRYHGVITVIRSLIIIRLSSRYQGVITVISVIRVSDA